MRFVVANLLRRMGFDVDSGPGHVTARKGKRELSILCDGLGYSGNVLLECALVVNGAIRYPRAWPFGGNVASWVTLTDIAYIAARVGEFSIRQQHIG